MVVAEVDARRVAVEPPVCLMVQQRGQPLQSVGRWIYGQALPSFQARGCGPLLPGREYRISIGGGGNGTAVFRTDEAGVPSRIVESCP